MVASTIEGPLSSVRILDLTHVWAGPLAVRTLADLGATVVKVERPFARGVHAQGATPVGGWLSNSAGLPNSDQPHWNRNGAYIKLQRNRFGLALDYKTEAGRDVLLELVAQADVIVENYSANAMTAMGLSYEVLKAANPQIIYVTMPGYGSTGPYSERVAFGTVIESLSALTYMTAYSLDDPYNSAQALPDAMGGMHTVGAITTALNQRKETGQGARVEVSLHESGVAISGPWLVAEQIDAEKPKPLGNRHPQMAPHGLYQCAGDDQWLSLACESDEQWQSLLGVIQGSETTALDKSNASQWPLAMRQGHAAEIDEAIAAWVKLRDKDEAAALLQAAGVPAGPVNSAPELLADEQLNARGFYDWHDRFNVALQGDPVHRLDSEKGSERRSKNWMPSPYLGEHNAQVLSSWLGYTDSKIAELEASGTLVSAPPE